MQRGSWAVFAVVMLLTACGPRYYVGDQTFDTKEQALAHVRSELDRKLPPPDPLRSPLAGPAVIIVPSLAHLETLFRRDYPGREDDLIELVSMADQTLWLRLARLVEERNIFRTVRIVKAASPKGIDAPAGGYLLWFERLGTSGNFCCFHILASGERKTTSIVDEAASRERYREITGEAGDTKTPIALKQTMEVIFLAPIEAFVKTHPPKE